MITSMNGFDSYSCIPYRIYDKYLFLSTSFIRFTVLFTKTWGTFMNSN